SGIAPENTLIAIKKAIENDGIIGIEIDVHLTKDEVPVVMHDDKIDRTTNGTGYIRDFSLEEIRQFDAGSWFGDDFIGEKVPTLSEVLDLCKGKKKVWIELKQTGNRYERLEEKVAELIQEKNMHHEVIVISFDHRSLRKIKELDETIQTCSVLHGMLNCLIHELKVTGASYVSINHNYVNSRIVQELLDASIGIVTWTVDEPEIAKSMVEMYDGLYLTTNHPEKINIKKERVESIF
ncbi:MAG TPA: glycerophosphodiester phosphodiesterase family protein, partial [Chondromyces sp.]|nr:glycerophosphodiester phosphodiesterase family protein [Chondromyces sp.]